MSEMCRFISFSALRDRIPQFATVTKFLKPEFLEELSESCQVEDEEE